MRKLSVLVASVIIQASLGSIYAWSNFVPGLKSIHGLTSGQAGMVFGCVFLLFTSSMILAGRIEARRGPTFTAMIGGLLFGVGYFIASLSGGDFKMILLGIGIISGIGTGFAYVCPISTCIKWFPDHKGLITGIAVGGFGGGAILVTQFVRGPIANGADPLGLFRIMAFIMGGAVIFAAILLKNPYGYSVSANSKDVCSIMELVHDRRYWGLGAGLFSGTFAGLLLVGNLNPIAISLGLPISTATLAVSALAIGNTSARIAWGWIYDRFGFMAIPVSLVILSVTAAALIPLKSVYVLMAVLIGFGFGANFVVYAGQTASIYGNNNVGQVYPWVFIFYGLSGLTGPGTGGWLFDVTGSYVIPVALCSLITIMGAVLCFILARPKVEKAQPDVAKFTITCKVNNDEVACVK